MASKRNGRTIEPASFPTSPNTTGNGTFFDFNQEKGTVKAKLYRGAIDGEKLHNFAYWSTDQTFAENYMNKTAYAQGKNANLYSTIAELPAEMRDGQIHLKLNGKYTLGSAGAAEKGIGVTDTKTAVAARFQKNRLEGSMPIQTNFDYSVQNNVGARPTNVEFILGKDMVDETKIKTIPRSEWNLGHVEENPHLPKSGQRIEKYNLRGRLSKQRYYPKKYRDREAAESKRRAEKEKVSQNKEPIVKAKKNIEPVIEEKKVMEPVPTKAKPTVSETKVEATRETYSHATEVHNTHTSATPPTPPQSPTKPNNLPKVNAPDTKAASKFLQRNQSKIILGAVGAGVVKSLIDGEDDDLLSSAGKGIKTGVVVGAGSYAAQHLLKSETVQDLVKGEISDVGKSVVKKANAERRMLSGGNKVGTALRIGLYAVGAATVLDVGQRAGENLEADRIKREQEFKLKQRKKMQKQKNKKNAYGHLNDGEIVFDLFEARTGHHKMGNAKFN